MYLILLGIAFAYFKTQDEAQDVVNKMNKKYLGKFFRTWSVWWLDGFLRIFTIPLLVLAPVRQSFTLTLPKITIKRYYENTRKKALLHQTDQVHFLLNA